MSEDVMFSFADDAPDGVNRVKIINASNVPVANFRINIIAMTKKDKKIHNLFYVDQPLLDKINAGESAEAVIKLPLEFFENNVPLDRWFTRLYVAISGDRWKKVTSWRLLIKYDKGEDIIRKTFSLYVDRNRTTKIFRPEFLPESQMRPV